MRKFILCLALGLVLFPIHLSVHFTVTSNEAHAGDDDDDDDSSSDVHAARPGDDGTPSAPPGPAPGAVTTTAGQLATGDLSVPDDHPSLTSDFKTEAPIPAPSNPISMAPEQLGIRSDFSPTLSTNDFTAPPSLAPQQGLTPDGYFANDKRSPTTPNTSIDTSKTPSDIATKNGYQPGATPGGDQNMGPTAQGTTGDYSGGTTNSINAHGWK